MAGRSIGQVMRAVTPYLMLLLFVATIGSLQFGFHLVSRRRRPSELERCMHASSHFNTAVLSMLSWILGGQDADFVIG